MYYRNNEADVRDDEQREFSEMDYMQCPMYQQHMMNQQPMYDNRIMQQYPMYECPMMYYDRDDYQDDDMFRKRHRRRRRRPCCYNRPFNNQFPWWLFLL